jgi:hypothetical protein
MIEYNAQRRHAGAAAVTNGQLRIVGKGSADPHSHGIALGAQPVHVPAGFLSREPAPSP